MEETQQTNMTAKNVALVAVAAYCGVKVVRSLGSMAVTAVSFRRNRKVETAA